MRDAKFFEEVLAQVGRDANEPDCVPKWLMVRLLVVIARVLIEMLRRQDGSTE